MAFNVAYFDLLDKNIRHIYSSLPSNVRFRCNPEPGVTLNPHDGCLTSHKKISFQPKHNIPQRLYRRLWAYNPKFDCDLPRAPAFRCVSTDEAQAIINRQMTRSHRHRQRQGHRHGFDSDERDSCSRLTNSRSTTSHSFHSSSSCTNTTGSRVRGDSANGRRCQSALDMQVLTIRLMQPTAAWQIRSDLREGSTLDPVQVVAQRSSAHARRSGSPRMIF